ncbi:MAG: LptF/LptG family permease [Rubricoccaceae bacterium]
MLARLHRSILKALPLPFVAAFSVLLFLLLMQFLIDKLPDLVGRGLPPNAVAELLTYSLAYMVTLAVPMAWLIALLAAFGRLSESRAYVVAKSAGVSLPRLAWPVLALGLVLTSGMAYFNNEMLPEANFRLGGLWRDISVSRPEFALEPGVFYTGIDGYAVRADTIPPDSSGLLLGVTVFEPRSAGGGQAVLTAERARIQTQYGGQRLTMLLENGEVHQRKTARGDGEPYERLEFGRYRMAFDLSNLGGFERRSRDGGSRTDRSMRTSQMIAFVDSLEEAQRQREVEVIETLARRARPEADTTDDANDSFEALAQPIADASPTDPTPPADTSSVLIGADRVVLDGLSAAERRTVYELAMNRVGDVRGETAQIVSAAEWDARRSDRYRVEIYKKNSLALACLVFVLIGVPLGLSIQRAGVGLVATLAVSVFLFYWVTLVVGEKLIDRGFFPPWLGMWVANVLVGALGIYLVARETRDPAWRDPIRALAGRFAKRGG